MLHVGLDVGLEVGLDVRLDVASTLQHWPSIANDPKLMAAALAAVASTPAPCIPQPAPWPLALDAAAVGSAPLWPEGAGCRLTSVPLIGCGQEG